MATETEHFSCIYWLLMLHRFTFSKMPEYLIYSFKWLEGWALWSLRFSEFFAYAINPLLALEQRLPSVPEEDPPRCCSL